MDNMTKMEKSRKISLFIVTAIFVAIVIWRMVVMFSDKQVLVGEVILEGPSVVKVGEFDQSKYKMLVKYSDKTDAYKPFYKAYIKQEDQQKLEKIGKHTITFTYEQCSATFEIEIIE